MQQTIPATDGWYVVTPVYAGAEPIEVRRVPIVAWRVGSGDPHPVVLWGNDALDRERVAIMDPSGVVRTRAGEYKSPRAYLDALRPEIEASRVPGPLADPEVAEEDRAHAPVQLIGEGGEELTLHAHEWGKVLELARRGGWEPAGTRHEGSGWGGSYDEPHNQRVEAADARALGEALERAAERLPAQRPEAEIAGAAGPGVVSLSAAAYLGGLKGRSFVEAIAAFARRGSFRIG